MNKARITCLTAFAAVLVVSAASATAMAQHTASGQQAASSKAYPNELDEKNGFFLSEAKADDQQIAEEIAKQLSERKKQGDLRDVSINLKVHNGTAWINGRVSSREQQQLALDVARQVKGVQHVVSELEIKALAPAQASGDSVHLQFRIPHAQMDIMKKLVQWLGLRLESVIQEGQTVCMVVLVPTDARAPDLGPIIKDLGGAVILPVTPSAPGAAAAGAVRPASARPSPATNEAETSNLEPIPYLDLAFYGRRGLPRRSKEVEETARQFAELEHQSAQLAKQIAQKEADKSPDAEELASLRKRLGSVIEQAFDLRQKLQQAEVGELKKRLADVEQSIGKREKHKDQIVGARIAELLEEDKDLRWNPNAGLSSPPGNLNQYISGAADPLGFPRSPAARQPAAGANPFARPKPPAPPRGASDGLAAPTLEPQQTGQLPGPRSAPSSSSTATGSRNRPSSDISKTEPPYASFADGRYFAETRKALIDTEFALKEAERKLPEVEKLAEHNAISASEAAAARSELERARRHADRVQREYRAQLELLANDREAAALETNAASQEYELAKKRYESGQITETEVAAKSLAVERAKNRLKSIESLLNLHAQAAADQRDDKPVQPAPKTKAKENTSEPSPRLNR